MANESSPKTAGLDARALIKDASVATESARQRLQHAQSELSELTEMLQGLCEVSASLLPVSEQLSDMTLSAARQVVAAGDGGKPFVALVAELSKVAQHSARALRNLESYVQGSATSLHAAIRQAQESSAELERITPALLAANRTPPPVPVEPPPPEKVVALELKIAPAKDSNATSDRRPTLIDEIWPGEPRSRERLN